VARIPITPNDDKNYTTWVDQSCTPPRVRRTRRGPAALPAKPGSILDSIELPPDDETTDDVKKEETR
jgi:hypothetical protein